MSTLALTIDDHQTNPLPSYSIPAYTTKVQQNIRRILTAIEAIVRHFASAYAKVRDSELRMRKC